MKRFWGRSRAYGERCQGKQEPGVLTFPGPRNWRLLYRRTVFGHAILRRSSWRSTSFNFVNHVGFICIE